MVKKLYNEYLTYIDHHFDAMIALTLKLAEINTHYYNYEGIHKAYLLLEKEFKKLNGDIQYIDMPPLTLIDDEGEIKKERIPQGLFFTLRPEAPIQIYLGGHIDSVYKINDTFQTAYYKSENIIVGPAVSDMKGGITILLKALEVFENTPFKEQLGFKVFINPDEEIGSPSSKSIIEKLSKGCQIGFIFEPALEDGSVVIQRKGSSNYTLFFKGKSAHAGRNILEGRSAIKALTYLIEELHKEIIPLKTLSLNVGYIKGGEQTNVVPEKALAKLNIRSENNEEMKLFDEVLHNLSKKISLESDVLIHIHKDSSKPPKKNDLATQSLFEILKNTAHELGITLEGKSSGGVCDGNDLSSFGITNIDTMGAVGGSLHTKDEYLNISSLKERTKLIALLLMKIANKEIDL